MSANLRIRLKFESTSTNHPQKCWFTFDEERCKLVSDVRHLIASRFSLKPQAVQLYMDDFLIPTSESAKVIRDNDTLQIRTASIIHQKDSSSSSSSSESTSEDELPKPKQAKLAAKSSRTQATSSKTKPGNEIATKKKLVAVTTKSSTGASHTKFHSTSSDSSSNSSSSSDSGNTKKTTSVQNQRGKHIGYLRGKSQWDVTSNIGMEKNTPKEQYLVRRGNSSRGRSKGIKLRNSHPNLVVGGPSDILSTSSKVYSRGRGRGRGRVDRSHVNLMEVVSAVKETFKKQQVQNKPPVDGQQPKEKQEAQVDEPSPDYSACPNLNGPPRPGDNLAFKVLELSSTYTPEVSEFKEGTVVDFDSAKKVVKIKFSESCLKRLARKAEVNPAGKFDVDGEDDKDSDVLPEQSNEIQVGLEDLIQPKLLANKTSPSIETDS